MRLLGPVEVRAGEAAARAPVPIERPVWRAVLAALALRPGQPCATEHLIDAVWDADPPAKPRSVLQSHVARLRGALEPDRAARSPGKLVVTVPGGYLLNVAPEQVDVERFRESVQRGLDATARADATAGLTALDGALALWRGQPFPELGDTGYATAQRTRLVELRRSAAVARLECDLALGRDDEAVAEAEALLGDDSLHEPLWAVLAVGRYRLGQQAAALAGLDRLRTRLRDDLGIDPSADVRELETAILNQADWLRGPWPLRPERRGATTGPTRRRRAMPDALAVRQRSPFVGRESERAALRRAVATAAGGEPRVVLLAGEPGVGKTRLAIEAAREVHAGGGTVLTGRCDERLGVPYQPLLEALSAWVRLHDADELAGALGPMPAHLGRLYPPLRELAGLRPPPSVDPATDRFHLFEAVAGWLRALAGEAPLLVLLDDLHWATAETVVLVRHLAHAPELPALLIGTYRDTDLGSHDPWTDALAELRTWPVVTDLALRGLDAGEVRKLLAAAGDAAAAATAEAVHAATGGNPFFVEELVAHLAERPQRGEPAAGPGGLPGEVAALAGVRDVVARRLRGLSAETVEVLRTAAVAGSEWDVPALAAAVGDEERVLRAVDEAVAAALVREAGGPEPSCTFAHELVRSVLEAQLTATRRQREHRHVAEALERVHGTARAGAVADHLRRAGPWAELERVVTASLTAARQAWHRAAFEEASAHCEAAIAVLDRRGGDPADVARLRQALGEVMYASRIDLDRGLEQLAAARDAYERLGDPLRAAAARTRIARCVTTFFSRVDVERARDELDAALAVLEPAGPSPELAEALTIRAATAGWELAADVGRDAALRAVETCRRVDDVSARLTAEAVAGLCLLADGYLAEGQRRMAAAHAEASAHGDPLATWTAAYCYALCGNLLLDPSGWSGWVAGELASGRYESAAGLRTALRGLLAGWAVARGRRAEAQRLEEEMPAHAVIWPWKWAYVDGRWDDAAQSALQVAEAALATGNRNSALAALWWASHARELQGRAEDAVALTERAADLLPARPTTWATLWTSGRLAVLLADRERSRALAHLDACERVLAAGEDHRGLAGLVALGRAVTADAPEEADAAFSTARDAYRRVDHRLLEVDALRRWGMATGRPEQLDEALALADRARLGGPWRAHLTAGRRAAAAGT